MLAKISSNVWSYLLLSIAAVGLAVGSAAAQDARSFYDGKTIRFTVGYGPGGGYDAYARMLAPHLEKATGATVIVQNQPGAGGLVALNNVYSAAGDGLQIMIVNGTAAVLSQLLEDSNVRYDLTKAGILGVVSSSPWIWIASPDSPMKSATDYMKPGVKVSWGAAGQIDGLGDGAAITCMTLKLDCKVVRGYQGSAAAAKAVAQGEMDALYVSDTSANQYVSSGSAKAIATMSKEKSRFFPNLPTIFDQVKLTPEQLWWFDFRATLDDLGRILVMPPDVPAAQLAFMQEAVKKALSDPQVVAEGEKTKRYIAFRDPPATSKMVANVLSAITPEQKKTVRDAIMKE